MQGINEDKNVNGHDEEKDGYHDPYNREIFFNDTKKVLVEIVAGVSRFTDVRIYFVEEDNETKGRQYDGCYEYYPEWLDLAWIFLEKEHFLSILRLKVKVYLRFLSPGSSAKMNIPQLSER